MNAEENLGKLGLSLPQVPAAAGNYLPAVRVGNLLHLSGVLCASGGGLSHTGQVGDTQTVDSGYAAARVCALNALANIKAAVGSLDQVVRLVYVTGFVNAVSGFADSPAVINGASDLFVAVFGENGRHARAAVAVAGLPKDSTVEIQVVVEVRT
ncbi:MAG: RidA family protein [Opitutaceae bacterium]